MMKRSFAKLGIPYSVEDEGRLAFEKGLPKSACPYSGSGHDHGKRHSWERGWDRARMAKQGGKRK
jgi:hypothetical protein